MRHLFKLIKYHPSIAIGTATLTLLCIIALLAPWLGTIDPTAISPALRARPPNAQFWFGTDLLGRDVYSRVLYGARVSLIVGFTVALLSAVIGTVIGLAAGFNRIIDAIAMRIIDGMMAIPTKAEPSRSLWQGSRHRRRVFCHISKDHKLGHQGGTTEELSMAIRLPKSQQSQLRITRPSF